MQLGKPPYELPVCITAVTNADADVLSLSRQPIPVFFLSFVAAQHSLSSSFSSLWLQSPDY